MKRTDNFQKFVKQKKGSAIKEEIRQDKKKAKKERAEAIEKHFAKKRAERLQGPAQEGPANKRANKYPKLKSVPAGGKKVVENTATSETIPVKKAEGKYSKIKGATADAKKVAENTATSETVPVKKAEGKYPKIKSAPAVAKKVAENTATSDTMPVNKFIAHSGICARRDAAVLVKEGKVLVNGEVAIDPGMKVTAADVVKVNGKRITPSKNFVYILLNKPKDYLTTVEDPQGRKTVLDLVKQATTERVYPVGRLDRNTSGVLLLTNDGELAQKLSHPKHEIKKVYEVRLDRALTKGDMDKIAAGITLEDGFVAPDVIAYADAHDKSIIGIEIHSGRNRIVRRIFEHFKYDVKGLDRVMFAGLTKKNVQRGKWRFLNEKEVRILKFLNQSFSK